MDNIFDELNKLGLVYSVVAEKVDLVLKRAELNTMNYFVMVADIDKPKWKHLPFKRSGVPRDVYVSAIDLKLEEVDFFKKNISKYVRVQHNKSGRVYELKNNSFKSYYEANKKQMEINSKRIT